MPAVHPARTPLALLLPLLPLMTMPFTAPALAATINVSQLVTGTAEATPTYLPGSIINACSSACRYVNVASAGASTAYDITPGPYVVGAWPPAWGSAVPGLASVDETLAITPPSGGQTMDGGATGVLRRAEVRFDFMPLVGSVRRMAVQTWKTGSGASVVSYGIRLVTPPGNARRTYLEFVLPTATRGWQEAYYVGGPSGYQPFYTTPERLQTRQAVDVYVDGLPVWSSASNLLLPKRFNPPYSQRLRLDWDRPLTGGDTTTLFLGTLPAGQSYALTVVLRTDLRIEAPTCKNDSEYGVSYQRCHSQVEALSLPARSTGVTTGPYQVTTYKPDLRVYTR
ncbi:hypothetical protein [Pseudorhodoferax sp.]|uniref:hypothetical protein n=1 Tax=Pseudorhodoferax sp. TaxID=1993553 RepID=UPI002DD6210C|nr:hypothetical protein [Pseudorhodoferax sp.]